MWDGTEMASFAFLRFLRSVSLNLCDLHITWHKTQLLFLKREGWFLWNIVRVILYTDLNLHCLYRGYANPGLLNACIDEKHGIGRQTHTLLIAILRFYWLSYSGATRDYYSVIKSPIMDFVIHHVFCYNVLIVFYVIKILFLCMREVFPKNPLKIRTYTGLFCWDENLWRIGVWTTWRGGVSQRTTKGD